jgi:hypothetical protein
VQSQAGSHLNALLMNQYCCLADCCLPDLGDDINGGLTPFSTEWKAAVQKRVDAFVVSLPLSHTEQDAEIEEKIAERLYDDEIAAAAIKSRLSEWYILLPIRSVVTTLKPSYSKVHERHQWWRRADAWDIVAQVQGSQGAASHCQAAAA